MIKRILNSRLPLMVHTPVKVFDVRYFHAIYQAGALPVFDTEFLSRDDIIQKALLLAEIEHNFFIAFDVSDIRVFFLKPVQLNLTL